MTEKSLKMKTSLGAIKKSDKNEKKIDGSLTT